jgi:hypothetical protein
MVKIGGPGVKVLLLLQLLFGVLPMSQAGPASTFTGEVAFVEHSGEEARVALLMIVGARKSYLSPEGLAVEAPVWSPRGERVLVRSNGSLELIRPAADFRRTALGAAPPDRPRVRWFSPDGQRVAIPRASTLSIHDVETGATAARYALPKGEEVADLLWHPDGSRLVLLVTQGSAHRLVAFDADRGAALGRLEVNCEALLGWRSGQLLVVRAGRHGQEAGTLAAKGEFRLLRAAPADRTEIYVEYLPASDRLLYVLGTEDPQDPREWFLSEPGLLGEKRWLAAFPRADEISFSGGGQWAVFIDRSRPELAGEPGGDLHLIETLTERSTLLMRASPGQTSYSSASIRPR